MADSQNTEMAEGLMRFYSSQVEVMLAQYRNINDLLGPTRHHTHPGTHCEILLRNCLRSFLPPDWSADKGYIYGRVSRDGSSVHSPEIDILIHNEKYRRPIFRMEDFVFVHPKSVIGMIQVKKNFDNDLLSTGLSNVVAAKQHLFDLIRDTSDGKFYLERLPFSAVIAFEGTLSGQTFERSLAALQSKYEAYKRPIDEPWNTSILALPDLVGTLSGLIAVADQGANRQGYELYQAMQGTTNIALQLILWKLTRVMPEYYMTSQPFAFPAEIQIVDRCIIGPGPDSAESPTSVDGEDN